MENQITIREAITETDGAGFWEQLHTYHKRDIFPNPDNADLEYFLGSEYHDHMMKIHSRPQDRCYFLFFHRDGQDIGFAMPVIYTAEDGKCFIMEFCVYPEFRGNGTGKECAGVLLNWAKENGALYAELNHGNNQRRRHFWETVGFIENGADEWGEPLMILPPVDDVPITVEILIAPEDWQLKKLENGFLRRLGNHRQQKKSRNSLLRQSGMAGSLSLWQSADAGLWECAVSQNASPPSPAPKLGFLRTSTLNRRSAKRALLKNWHKRHKPGAPQMESLV